MRILLDARTISTTPYSGIPLYAHELFSRILKDRKNTYLLLSTGLSQNKIPKSWLGDNVSVLRWKTPNKILELSLAIFNRPNFSSGLDLDLVFSPHLNIFPVSKAPRVLTCHDISFFHHPSHYGFAQNFWHFRQRWLNQLRQAKKIIAVSEYTKNDLVRSLGLSDEKISVVYPGISGKFKKLDAFDPRLEKFRQKYGLLRPFVLFLGSLSQRKNLKLLLSAFSLAKKDGRFSDYELVLAGGLSPFAKQIFRLAKSNEQAKSIRFFANFPESEKLFLYNCASLFVFPSFFEGFGFPPLEAQACGTPVVATRRTSLVETLGSSAILTDPWKSGELAQIMLELSLDEKRKKELSRLGLINAARFSWDKCAKDTLLLLEETRY